MSFTLNSVKGARAICKIVGGMYNGLTLSYIDEKMSLEVTKDNKYMNFKSLKLEDGKFEPTVDTTQNRQVVSCFGCSGSGKSWFCKSYLNNYHKSLPDNDMFLICPFTDDVSLKDVKGLGQFKLDQDWVKDPVMMKDIPQDSCVVIDDLDVEENKDIQKLVTFLKGQLLKGGRHKNITLLTTEHVSGTADASTRNLLLESHMIVLYLKSGGNYTTILQRYLGLDTKQIAKLKKMDTRWVCFVKSYPQMFYTEKEIGFLADL